MQYVPRAQETARGSGLVPAVMQECHISRPVAPKTPARKSQAIRDSAKGEPCLMRLPGCPGDPAMTIWSHARFGRAGKGLGIKAIDICGAYTCTYCDSVFDGQRRSPGLSVSAVEIAWHQAHLESLVRLRQKGLA